MHQAHMELSLDSHIFKRRIELATKLSGRKSVYLDMNFWANLCDVTTGRNNDPTLIALLERLRYLVLNGHIFCPISSTTFWEILKHKEYSTRKATALLVDELSFGVAIVDAFSRMELELCFLLAAKNEFSVDIPQNIPWTKVGYIMGLIIPTGLPFDDKTTLSIHINFFDYLWRVSLTKMCSTLNDSIPPITNYAKLSMLLNQLNAEHANELTSFNETYRTEAAAMADIYTDIVLEMFNIKEFTDDNMKTPIEIQNKKMRLTSIIESALNDDVYQNIIPTAFIRTSLHAKLRWNKGQKIDKNDFEDFDHASIALGYCNFFFTERSLAAALLSGPLHLAKYFDCTVASNPIDCLKCLGNINC